jgi:hypothetical protein
MFFADGINRNIRVIALINVLLASNAIAQSKF